MYKSKGLRFLWLTVYKSDLRPEHFAISEETSE